LGNEAHLSLQRRLRYVGERIKWFFERQKEPVLEFMDGLDGTPSANLYSPLYTKHGKLMKENKMIQHLVFQTYDGACARQLQMFNDLFDNMLTSAFANPWMFLRSSTAEEHDREDLQDAVLPSFDDTRERIPKELGVRASTEPMLSKWLVDIPNDPHEVDEAVDKVQMLVLKTYGFIRSHVCDQVELFSESFFKLPMLRRLEESMATLDLTDDDSADYQSHRDSLSKKTQAVQDSIVEISNCIDRLQGFKLKNEAQKTM